MQNESQKCKLLILFYFMAISICRDASHKINDYFFYFICFFKGCCFVFFFLSQKCPTTFSSGSRIVSIHTQLEQIFTVAQINLDYQISNQMKSFDFYYYKEGMNK